MTAQEIADQSPQEAWRARARAVLPAGGFGNFDARVFIAKGRGARVWDEDGKEYVDYLIGSGPMLLGHDHEEVAEAVREQMAHGLTFFANNAKGVELGEAIAEACACVEQVRYVSTGGEADMYAMRLARAFTGRERILKFEGGYHGMSGEALMSLSPTKLVNFPQAEPDTAGVPESVRDSMLIAPYNDADFARGLIAEHAHEIAAVIVEPLQRIIAPEPGFLEALREETAKHGILLIFDEVVTGFRLAYGGAQERYGVTPDICTLGKIIGGGFPLAALGARREIMAHFDKPAIGAEKWLYQIGTLSGNPVAAAAGLKTMEILRRPGMYDRLIANGQRVMDALTRELTAAGVPFHLVGDPVLFEVVFSAERAIDYRGLQKQDKAMAARFNAALRSHGVLKPDSKWYASIGLTEADLAWTEAAIAQAAKAL